MALLRFSTDQVAPEMRREVVEAAYGAHVRGSVDFTGDAPVSASLTGRYEISETYNYVDSDPICIELPGKKCTTNITRVGKGAVPLPPDMKANDTRVAGPSRMEVDSVAGGMIVVLLSPFMVSAYEEAVLSNDPETANGTTSGNIMFPSVAIANTQFTFPVKGALVGQSGVEKIKIKGASGEKRILDPTVGEDGELTIRWSLSAG